MKLPYLRNPIYRAARLLTPEKIKPTLRGWYNALNKLATYRRQDVFTALDIEINSRCNLRCRYCPVSLWNRGDALMPDDLYRKIIDDLADFPFPYRGRVSPHFYNDPLVDRRLPELMRYTREKLPHAVLLIHTNGVALTREFYRSLIASGIDGMLITRHTRVLPRSVLDIIKSEPDADRFLTIQSLKHVGLFERGGIERVARPHRLRSCYYLSDEIAIDYRGNVVCTNDFFIRDPFGNVHDASLKDIWWEKRFVDIRKKLKKGKIALSVCRDCMGDGNPRYTTVPANARGVGYFRWPT
ncbi:MAG: radical SAM/SPASM domain-containing protein [Patescibacteria group bacterium]